MKPKPITHISLDFWNTIGMPNPVYGRLRTSMIARYMETSEDIAAHTYTKVKRYLDHSAEEFGIAFTTLGCWNLLARQFDKEHHGLNMMIEAGKLFSANQPTILSETCREIKRLSEKGIRFSIGSNTNFIEGALITDVLADNDINHFFKFRVYSDVVFTAKPSRSFFKIILTKSGVRFPDDILHIGDSMPCDDLGAARVGMQSRLIKSVLDLPAVLSQY